MKRLTVQLSERQERALKSIVSATGRSEADLIGEGIDAITARYRVTEPTLPLFDSGRADLAVQADQLLKGFGESEPADA